MKFAPDGYRSMATTGILALLSIFLCPWSLAVTLPLFAVTFWFYRDPDRTPDGDGIVSAADGVVVEIFETEHPYTGRALKVGVFMNPFNVHVNRMPSSGEIQFLEYVPGKKWVASAEKASEVNERHYMGYMSEHGPVLVCQIAGLLARRIVCRHKKGEVLERAQRFGMIKLGSKVDVYLPLGVKCIVKVGQKVLAGKTVIAEARQ
ncbi:MAG: phosphatidylserine decarboxylase [Pyramidobacter sp.]|nr:phosphatidylserine decarboxylase [Pyramidobacter sp.]